VYKYVERWIKSGNGWCRKCGFIGEVSEMEPCDLREEEKVEEQKMGGSGSVGRGI